MRQEVSMAGAFSYLLPNDLEAKPPLLLISNS